MPRRKKLEKPPATPSKAWWESREGSEDGYDFSASRDRGAIVGNGALKRTGEKADRPDRPLPHNCNCNCNGSGDLED